VKRGYFILKFLCIIFLILCLSYETVAQNIASLTKKVVEVYRMKIFINEAIKTGKGKTDDLEFLLDTYYNVCADLKKELILSKSDKNVNFFIRILKKMKIGDVVGILPVISFLRENLQTHYMATKDENLKEEIEALDIILEKVDLFLSSKPKVERYKQEVILAVKQKASLKHEPAQKQQTQKTKDSLIKLFDVTDDGCKVSFKLPKLTKQEVELSGKRFIKFKFSDCGYTSKVGMPELPVYRTFIGLPKGATNIKIRVIEATKDRINTKVIVPVQPPLIDSSTIAAPPFTMNKKFYSKDIIYPRNSAKLVKAGKMHGNLMYQLTISPLRYNPKSKTLIISKNITVQVSYKSATRLMDISSGSDYFENPRDRNSFSPVYEKFMINYDALKDQLTSTKVRLYQNNVRFMDTSKSSKDIFRTIKPIQTHRRFEEGADIVIICPDEFASLFKDYIEWKTQRGLFTKLFKLSEVGTDSEDIYRFLKECYTRWPNKPTYVILVGDVQYIPTTFKRTPYYGEIYGKIGTDFVYSLLDGNDSFPDVYIGRFPVNNKMQCRIIVNKILNYEKNPPRSTRYYTSALSAAYYQRGRVFHKTGKYLSTYWKKKGFKVFEAFTWEEQGKPEILAAFNKGIAFANYRGHGQPEAWEDPELSIYDTEDLKNEDLHPVVFSISCLSGRFFEEGVECLGEQLLEKKAGAVAFVGATMPSYSFYNDDFNKALIRSLFAKKYRNTLAPAVLKGEYYMCKKYGIDDEKVIDQLYFYNILGDPSLNIWTGVPVNANVSVPKTVEKGSKFYVKVKKGSKGIKDVLVCLMDKKFEFYSTRFTNTKGNAKFSIPEDVDISSMILTVSGANIRPQSFKIEVK